MSKEVCIVDSGSYKCYAKVVPVHPDMIELSLFSVLDTAKDPTGTRNLTKQYLSKEGVKRLSELLASTL